jgi:hypothetical protein
MIITVRITSKQDVHVSDEFAWPANVPLSPPQIGDSVTTTRFGIRQVLQRYFNYQSLGYDRPVGEVTRLIVDVICE